MTVSALCCLLVLNKVKAAESPTNEPGERLFAVKGVILELKPDDKSVVIRHEVIPDFMAVMTMPFNVKTPKDLLGLHSGDEVSFQLHVTETESWVDQIRKTGSVILPEKTIKPAKIPPVAAKNSLRDYEFTNELGHAVSLNSFKGQALAVTFIYTRCPLPEYCPRLSKNFQEAAQKLAAMTNAPANWHFLSITFDPEFDSPDRLKAYGETYQYDPAHWSFLTGPTNEIQELSRQSGVETESDGYTINHNFRTLIIDANSHLQMVFPTSGDLSDGIVEEILKAAAVTK